MHKSFRLYLFVLPPLFASLLTPKLLYAGPSVSPGTISFGSVTLASAAAPALSTVTFTNNGRQRVTILQVTSSSSVFAVSGPALPLVLSGHSSAVFGVSFVPTTAGTFTGTITFTTSFKNSSGLTVNVSGTATAAAPAPTHLLYPSTTSIAFGNVLVGTSSSQTLLLNNTGNSDVSISGVSLSGSSFSVSGFAAPISLAAGQSLSLVVSCAPNYVGSYIGSITVISNATNPATVALSGTGVQPAISVVPTGVSFSNVTVGVTNSQTVTISNPGTANLTVSQVSLVGSGFSYSGLALPLTIAQGASSLFTVAFTPTSATTFSATLTLSSNAPASSLTIPLSGAGTSPILTLSASPSSLAFPTTTTGATSASQTVTLTNTGNSAVTISGVTVTGTGFSTSGITPGIILMPNQSATMNVAFAPLTAGSLTGSVSVVSNATNSPTTISLSGSGVPPVSSGPQFYVSTTGNDANSGTSLSAPWQTIQKAMNNATTGSTVNIMAGTYNERLTLGVSGTAGNYITFQPNGFSVPSGGCGGYTGVTCGGDQVILDYTYLGTVSDGVPYLHISGKSHIRVQGITFQNFTTHELSSIFNKGVFIESSNFIEVKNNKFLNIKDTGPHDGTSALGAFRITSSNNLLVYGNEFGNMVTNYGETLTDDVNSTFFTAENNWIHDTDGIGIDLGNGANNFTIRSNKLEYISIKRDGSVWYGNPSIAVYNVGGNTGVIERNFVDHAGVGFEVQPEPGDQATHDVTIRNNVVQNSQTGIVLGTWYSNTDGSSVYNINVFNNTFYRNGTGIVVRPMTSASVSWENNIFANNGTAYVNTLNWNPGKADYNLYFGGGTGPGANSVTLNPLFNNALAGDFSLQPTSPAINAGDPNTSATVVGAADFAGNPRIVGGRIDIGAYEAQ